MAARPASAKPPIRKQPSASSRKKFPFQDIAVLVVEDAPHLSGIICGILKSFGIATIYPARTGADALFILANHRVQVAIIDDLGPPLDGKSVIRELRSPDSGLPSEVPVIYVTGKPFKDDIFSARDAGANEVLSKPFSASQLMARIEAVLKKPRPIVRSVNFVGPDRRRQVKESGERRRAADRNG